MASAFGDLTLAVAESVASGSLIRTRLDLLWLVAGDSDIVSFFLDFLNFFPKSSEAKMSLNYDLIEFILYKSAFFSVEFNDIKIKTKVS